MQCLNCGQEMVNVLVHTPKAQISYDTCEACGSFWLDAGELDKMAFQVEGSIEFCSKNDVEGLSGPSKTCPRCKGEPLVRAEFLRYTDVFLDHCRNCGGFWLDGGELDLIDRKLENLMPVSGKGFSEFVNNVHLPRWCKRVRRPSSETDFAIEVPPIKGAKMKSQTSCVCPACGAGLSLYTLHGVEFEGCPTCKGVWLDRDELRKLKDRAKTDSWSLRWMDDEVEAIEKAHATASLRRCPKCTDARLVTTTFGDSQTIIDWCPSCRGTWLDRDEFQEIMRYLEAKLHGLSSAEMKQKVIDEIKEIWTGPEGTMSELLDAKVAVSALLSIWVFEHPALYNMLQAVRSVGKSIG